MNLMKPFITQAILNLQREIKKPQNNKWLIVSFFPFSIILMSMKQMTPIFREIMVISCPDYVLYYRLQRKLTKQD